VQGKPLDFSSSRACPALEVKRVVRG